MNNIVYISDFFHHEILGGGELNDQELIFQINKKLNHEILKIKSANVTLKHLNKNNKFIISNFVNLSEDCKQFLSKNCNYIIYEHDHKYIRNRNPAIYNDYLAPKEEITNFQFYKNSKTIFCQSELHKNIIYKNLNLNNIFNLSGNLWSDDVLNYINSINNNHKNDKFAILCSPSSHKNTNETINYCNYKNYKFDLVSDPDYITFLKKLSYNKGLVFLPKTPETLSRLAVEARMLNMQTICNKNVGATYEDWYSLKGRELVDFMFKKKQTIVEVVLEKLNE